VVHVRIARVEPPHGPSSSTMRSWLPAGIVGCWVWGDHGSRSGLDVGGDDHENRGGGDDHENRGGGGGFCGRWDAVRTIWARIESREEREHGVAAAGGGLS
jgi:hypothetical protein